MTDFDGLTLGPEELEALSALSQAEFYRCTLQNIDFSKLQDAKRLKFFDCRLESCRMANIDLTSFVFRSVQFQTCNLMGLNWTLCSQLSDPEFRSSKLDMSSFQGLELTGLKCIDCSARDVDFYQTILKGADFSETQLQGSNFNGADLRNADLRRAEQYWIDPTLSKLKGARMSYPGAEILLKALGVTLE